MKRVLFVLGFLVGFAPLPARAQIPQTMSYQGVLTDGSGNLVSDGPYNLTFKLYTVALGGSAIWTETQSSVAVMKGSFSVILGSITPLTPGFDQQYYLGIAVNGGAELAPRVALASSPYALEARTVADSVIDGAKIANGQVVRSLNSLTDQVTLVAGSNISITPAGPNLTISSTGGGLTLPFSGLTSTAADAFVINDIGVGGNCAHFFLSNTAAPSLMAAVLGENASTQSNARGVMGLITSTSAGNVAAGVWGGNSSTGSSGFGVIGVHAGTGYGVHGEANGSGVGVHGQFDAPTPSANAAAVLGEVPAFVTNGLGYAVKGTYGHGTAIYGQTQGFRVNTYGVFGDVSALAPAVNTAGVYGVNEATNGNGYGVIGAHNGSGGGVHGVSVSGTGVDGVSQGSGIGVLGQCDAAAGIGVQGTSLTGTAVSGISTTGMAFYGESQNTAPFFKAVYCVLDVGSGASSTAILGENKGSVATSRGITGLHDGGGYGVFGESDAATGIGVYGFSTGGTALLAQTGSGTAGKFVGNVTITGNLTVSGSVAKGSGSFMIDHPLDPANKYLAHSFVESPDMMNVYDGNVVLNERGEATIELPSYFEALNRDFRYQLTAIGAPGPNLYVADEVRDNRFRIAGGAPGAKVSWQVTGIRHDPVANAHRIVVEQEKVAAERGRYLDPGAYGQPADKAIGYRPASAAGTPQVAKEVH